MFSSSSSSSSMGNEKFTWVIKDYSFSQCGKIYSDEFEIGGCKWFLMGVVENLNYLSLCLVVSNHETFPCGWKILTKYRLTVVNQHSDHLSKHRVAELWLDEKLPIDGSLEMISLTKLNDKNGGFLVNNEVKIVAEVDVLEVIGILDVSEESQPLKKMKLNDDGAVSSSVDVKGFQVLPSQAESVKRIFERHPDLALEFRAKNQPLRTSCINVLLNLIETLCLSLQDLSIDDLGQAEQALTYLKYSGFKVDWLEFRLEEVKVKKIEEQIGKTRMQELEEELKVFKQKCSDKEALLEKEKEEIKNLKQKCLDTEALLKKEKAKVLAAARASPLTLDDVIL